MYLDVLQPWMYLDVLQPHLYLNVYSVSLTSIWTRSLHKRRSAGLCPFTNTIQLIHARHTPTQPNTHSMSNADYLTIHFTTPKTRDHCHTTTRLHPHIRTMAHQQLNECFHKQILPHTLYTLQRRIQNTTTNNTKQTHPSQ